jgi:hypothetical protein
MFVTININIFFQVPIVIPVLPQEPVEAPPPKHPPTQPGAYLNNAAYYSQNTNKHIVRQTLKNFSLD